MDGRDPADHAAMAGGATSSSPEGQADPGVARVHRATWAAGGPARVPVASSNPGRRVGPWVVGVLFGSVLVAGLILRQAGLGIWHSSVAYARGQEPDLTAIATLVQRTRVLAAARGFSPRVGGVARDLARDARDLDRRVATTAPRTGGGQLLRDLERDVLAQVARDADAYAAPGFTARPDLGKLEHAYGALAGRVRYVDPNYRFPVPPAPGTVPPAPRHRFM